MNYKYSEVSYKFRTEEDLFIQLSPPIKPSNNLPFVDTKYINLNNEGMLLLKCGFGWNGVTGGITTDATLLPSAIHDALDELMQRKLVSADEYKQAADEIYLAMLKDRGVSLARITAHRMALGMFGGNIARVPAKEIKFMK